MLTSAIFHVPFYFFVSYAMIRYLFHDDQVTRDELYATGAAFTVVAWAFAYLYAAVQVLDPGSFVNYDGVDDLEWFELLFLSFTTLTSVGSVGRPPGAGPRPLGRHGRAGGRRALRRARHRPPGGADGAWAAGRRLLVRPALGLQLPGQAAEDLAPLPRGRP